MRSDGEVVQVRDDEEAKRRNLVPIPDEEREKVMAMSREERRAWFRARMAEREKANRKDRRRKKRERKAAKAARRRMRAAMKRRRR